MGNYSTLQRNTLDGLSEMAGMLYLKLTDVYRNEHKAFIAACRFEDNCAATIDYILRSSPVHNLDEKTMSEISHFFSERWRNNFLNEVG